MHGNFTRENREVPSAPDTKLCTGRLEKDVIQKSNMYVDGKSDGRAVPTKCLNKSGNPLAEGAEGRRPAKENTEQTTASQTQSWGDALSGLRGVREAAKRDKRLRFTALLHHVSVLLLESSFYALKRDAAPGVDGVTWTEYETGLGERLNDLHSRVHQGTYRAQPSKRAYIPKTDGRKRPLGIAALEDKIVQYAVMTVLNQIYEEDFLGFSYGFRPGRRQHDALDALWVGVMRRKVNWILDADIRSFFDEIRHDWLLKFVKHRIADQRILRLIRKWLRAGVSEEGQWSKTERGTPQGSVISPLLANVYLHYVFDLWVQHWRQHRTTGEVIVVRYADDAVLGFQHRADAEQFLRDWKERLSRFGLELHPDKTRLIEFGRNAVANRKERGEGKPETFNFLGFTHICGQTWKSGKFLVLRKTIQKRLSTKLRALKEELRRRKHLSVAELGKWLRSVVQGYFNYHAVPGNLSSLRSFRLQVIRRWMRALRRRSQKSSDMEWPVNYEQLFFLYFFFSLLGGSASRGRGSFRDGWSLWYSRVETA
jgi:RNA-directed DNA polymerase